MIERDGRYLVGRRPAHKPLPGLWEFPGGKLEPGETFADAATRELREELGLTMEEVGDVLFQTLDPTGRYLVCFVEVAMTDEQEPSCLEHAELTWATVADLDSLELAPSDRSFLAHLLRSERPDVA